MNDYHWQLEVKYSPDQPRVPAGDPQGGQWTQGAGGQGPTLPTGARNASTPHFVPDPDRWYIRPDRDARYSVEETQKWADKLEAQGWDVDWVVDYAWKGGIFPQRLDFDYSPDWGTETGKEYVAYRGGTARELTNPNGVFLTPERDAAADYAGIDPGQTVGRYTVRFDRPLYANWQGELTKSWFNRNFNDLLARGKDRRAANARIDARIHREAKKRGYDAIIYLQPKWPATREIVMLDPKKITYAGTE